MDLTAFVQQLGNWTSQRGPLHARLAQAVEQSIYQGFVLPGTRLPAERALAHALALSRTTVLSAYNTLRSGGWVESRPGSGTWVCKRAESGARQRSPSLLPGSPTINLLSIDDRDTIDFAVATTVPLADLPARLFSVDPDVQASLLRERSYMPFGMPQLRDAIARHFTHHLGLPTTADQILVTAGAQHAISLISALYVQRGDAVLVENPTYFGALDAFRMAGARLAPIAVGPGHVNAKTLRDHLLAIGPRLIYLTPTYQNPTGTVMAEPDRRSIAKLAEETGVPIVEDGALAELSIGSSPPAPIASHSQGGVILTIGSLSKLYWAGLRVGWLRGPASVIAQLARVRTASDLASPSPTQAIAVQLLSVFEEAKALRSRQLLTRRDFLVKLLRTNLPEWNFSLPEGGLFLWVQLPHADGRSFAQCAARHRVAVTPGNLFTADDSHAEFLRIPFVLDEESLAAGVERLSSAWREFQEIPQGRTARMSALV